MQDVRAGDDALQRGKIEDVARHYESAATVARSGDDTPALLLALERLGDLYTTYPRLEKEEEAIRVWLEGLAVAETGLEPGEAKRVVIGHFSYKLGETYTLLARYTDAVPRYEKALAMSKPQDAPGLQAVVRSARRRAGLPLGDAAPAIEFAEPTMPGSLPIDPEATYLRPNAKDSDGTAAFIHLTSIQMPLRIALSRPRKPAKDGGSKDARDAAIAAMRLWEEAIQPWLPWFQLEFVAKDPTAPVQIEWVRGRDAGGEAAGRAWITWEVIDGELRVGGRMTLAMQPYAPYSTTALRLDEIRMLVAHEFGHILGLSHCLDCDSAMNYSWQTRERIFVTELDVLTFRALIQQPNGYRVDGRPMKELGGNAAP